jgi:hypothetical protein
MVKVKLSLCLINYALCHDDIWGVEVYLHKFVTLALNDEWSVSCPSHFTLEESGPSTPTGQEAARAPEAFWMLWKGGKISCPCQEWNPDFSAIHTNWAILVSNFYWNSRAK